jgi:predicted dehydrogenase
VYVAAPVNFHKDMVIDSARAGKHVMCEKPIAENAGQGREMADAVAAAGVASVLAFPLRHYPVCMQAKDLIDGGFIGDIRHIIMTVRMGVPGGVNRQWTWLNDASQGGGMLAAMAIHRLDLIRFWFGDFAEVFGRTHRWSESAPDAFGVVRPITAEDSFAMYATLANGALLTCQLVVGAWKTNVRQIELYGTKGSLVLEGESSIAVARADQGELETIASPAASYPPEVQQTFNPSFGMLIHDLVHSIDTGTQVGPSLLDGLKAQEVLDAIHSSEQNAQLVRI